MSRMSRAPAVILAAAIATLAGCSRDDTSAPLSPPTSLAASHALAALGAPEAEDAVLGTGKPDGTPGSDNAASGGRASGHAEFTVGGIKSMYTFTAISTTVPTAAKGRFQLHRWFPDGSMLVMTGEVLCMTLLPTPRGARARMAGRVESLRVDNVDVFVPADRDRALWTVQDGGEGADATLDFASGLFNFRSEAVAQAHCRFGSPITIFGTPDNNIQVHIP